MCWLQYMLSCELWRCLTLLMSLLPVTVELLVIYIFKRSLTMKIGVERVNQASKLTRTEVNNIVDVAVNCVQIVEQILRQSPRSALSMP